MAGSWPSARGNIVTQLNGITWDAGAAFEQETLRALEYPPATMQPSIIPYCYVIPPARDFQGASGKLRVTTIPEARVRFVLGREGANLEEIAKRMEAAVEAVASAFDDAHALDGNADVVNALGTSELHELDEGWGFELRIGLRVSETKTLGP